LGRSVIVAAHWLAPRCNAIPRVDAAPRCFAGNPDASEGIGQEATVTAKRDRAIAFIGSAWIHSRTNSASSGCRDRQQFAGENRVR
jgi:hypothetical protein